MTNEERLPDLPLAEPTPLGGGELPSGIAAQVPAPAPDVTGLPAAALATPSSQETFFPDLSNEEVPATVRRTEPLPVAPPERVAAVDVLRGVALLGILTMNIVSFGWPFSGYKNPIYSGGDDLPNRVAWFVNSVVFHGKMMTLFSMLFGAGLVLMSERAEARGARIAGIYYRRVLWLLVIGLIHAYLIWYGDILVFYALCGMLLYPFRRVPPRFLIGIGGGLIVLGILFMLGCFVAFGFVERIAQQVEADRAAGIASETWQTTLHKVWSEGLKEMTDSPAQHQREIDIYRGDYLEILAHRIPFVLFFQIGGFVGVMWWAGGGRMLIGMGLMKLGVFAAERSRRFYRRMALLGYGVGLPLTVGGTIDMMFNQFNLLHAPLGLFFFELGQIPMALGHAAVVMMVCQSGALTWLTRPLAAVGRMALTNYLMQSLICTTLFYGYGFGWFGHLDRVALWGVVAAIWGLQLVVSPIWLTLFRFGPAEWLWRSLTYGRLQPMR